jgi:molybdopterin/thiamine biosynthesis adenylyltransferase
MHEGSTRLLVREVHLLGPSEFTPGIHGYRQLAPSALARLSARAHEERLGFISCHSHPSARDSVSLSKDDLAGHDRVFPHLLDIVSNERPVGGIAFGDSSAVGDIWLTRDRRAALDRVDVIGESIRSLRPFPSRVDPVADRYDRQARMFGDGGQLILRGMTAAIVGLGGGGSIVNEHLAHLGVGTILGVDFDRIETHNLSRIVGAVPRDAQRRLEKVEVARRLTTRIDPSVNFVAIDGNITDSRVAARVAEVDFIFLCTDTIASRLVANSIAQAHLIPMVQIGAKIDRPNGRISSIYVAVRPTFPRHGCLACAGMIDPVSLRLEGATGEERAAQNYLNLPEVIDPSVITLNSIAASAATNLMLMSVTGLAQSGNGAHRLFDARSGSWLSLEPQRDSACLWCGENGRSRFARGDEARLPVQPSSEIARPSSFLRRWRRR